MVSRQIVAPREGQAKEPLRAVERRGHHVLEREVGLELGVVERIARLPQLLGVVAPVPGRDADAVAARVGQRLQGVALSLRLGARRGPYTLEQFGHRGRGARHAVHQGVVGEVRVAVQACKLGPQVFTAGYKSRTEAVAASKRVPRPACRHGHAASSFLMLKVSFPVGVIFHPSILQ